MSRKDSVSRRSVLAVIGGTSLAGLLAFRAEADQPHMEAALDHLKKAQDELKAALPDKGGHRAKAINLVRSAIAEVERGIGFAKTH